MIEIQGRYAKDVKIFTDDVEEDAVSQIYEIANTPVMKDLKIRQMPDTHLGKGICIGFTCPMGSHVNPNHIGVDIGCSVSIDIFDKVLPKEDYPLFEHKVKETIPTGFNINEKQQFDLKDFTKFIRKELQKAIVSSGGLVQEIPFSSEKDISNWCKGLNMEESVFYKSIGTLGGGNHYLELDYNEEQDIMGFTVHTGSRNLGQKVCGKWNKMAKMVQFNKIFKEKFEEQKKLCKDKTKLAQIKKDLKAEMEQQFCDGYLSGELLNGYLTDMVICQAYAKYNHKIIHQKIFDIYKKMVKGCKIKESIISTHNYLDFGDMIIRKGAIRAYEGEKMLIPFNMKDGIAICEGKSNPDWNFSGPHGSGRKMSRAAAKKNLSMEEFKETMSDVYSTSVCQNTIDEAPMAYKPTEEIVQNIEPTCKILYFMKPVINIKDSTDSVNPWEK